MGEKPVTNGRFTIATKPMSRFNKNEPELLPGAVLEEDCQTALPCDAVEEEDHHDKHDVTWTAVPGNASADGNGLAGWQRRPAPWAAFLERLALRLERPFNKLIGTPQLNPFYHTGTIAVFLTLVVGLTGTAVNPALRGG